MDKPKKRPIASDKGYPCGNCQVNMAYNRAIDDYEMYLNTRTPRLTVESVKDLVLTMHTRLGMVDNTYADTHLYEMVAQAIVNIQDKE